MSKLALFYILLSTDAGLLAAFNNAGTVQKAAMLSNAGVVNASEMIKLNTIEMEALLINELVAQTGAWRINERIAGNVDNKNNIGNIGLRKG